MKSGRQWLISGGFGSLTVALLHLVIIFIGSDAYRFFGAGEEMATGAEHGSIIPATITFVIVIVFFVFGLYAFSAAGLVRPLWKLKPIILALTTIYLLRGLGFFIEILGILNDYDIPVRHAVFSFVSLAIGIFHLVGLIRGWKDLSVSGTKAAI
jgi:hypothetical protein